MEILYCDLGGDCSDVIRRAAEVLKAGGLVINPTDTCYGIAADIFNKAAIENLYAQKGMPLDKPISILVRSIEEAKIYGVFSEFALRLAQEFWPGPLTLVVPRTDALPPHINPSGKTVGIRVIDDPVSVSLLDALGGPITTTSANAHGMPSPYSVKEVSVEADLMLDVGELSRRQKPSTIIQVEGDTATMIRQGDLNLDLGPSR